MVRQGRGRVEDELVLVKAETCRQGRIIESIDIVHTVLFSGSIKVQPVSGQLQLCTHKQRTSRATLRSLVTEPEDFLWEMADENLNQRGQIGVPPLDFAFCCRCSGRARPST